MIGSHIVPLRIQLLRSAMLACLGAASLLPLCIDDTPAGPQTLSTRPHPAAEAVVARAPVLVRGLGRDPFAHEQYDPAATTVIITEASNARPHPFTVVAVATGAAAHALVAQDGATRVVSAGDRLNGIRIASVDPSGVRLDDGTFISLGARP